MAFGDSLTEGWGAGPEAAFPARLEKELGVRVVNAGWRGDRAEDAFFRLESQVLSERPRLVIVEFGSNEALQGEPIERARAGLEKLLVAITRHGIPVLLVGVRHGAYQENFESVLRAIAETYGCELVLDVLAGILGRSDLRSDADHPNAAGYRILAQRLVPAAQRALERPPRKKQKTPAPVPKRS